MKKILLLSLLLTSGLTALNAQTNLISEGFDDITTLSGWTQTNQSSTTGTNPNWFQGNNIGNSGPFDSYSGAADSYVACNYNSVGTGDISNWLITPTLSLQNGDIISFYTRTVSSPAYPDRLQILLSTTGNSTTIPSGGPTDVGSFTTTLIDINPSLTASGYPSTWTLYTATISGLSSATDCKIAFRYYVTDGGPSGTNSDYIGVDSFSVDRPLSTENFFTQNFKVYPNPATNFIQLESSSSSIEKFELIDINGRIVSSQNTNAMAIHIDITDLQSGMYLLNVYTESEKSQTKILKY